MNIHRGKKGKKYKQVLIMFISTYVNTMNDFCFLIHSYNEQVLLL